MKSLKTSLISRRDYIRDDLNFRGADNTRYLTYVAVVFLQLDHIFLDYRGLTFRRRTSRGVRKDKSNANRSTRKSEARARKTFSIALLSTCSVEQARMIDEQLFQGPKAFLISKFK